MTTPNFDRFLAMARAEAQAQRLLFVFSVAELPPTATPGQQRRFQEGRGGALEPVMCVDKDAAELADFAALLKESEATGQPWDMVFAAALAGRDGAAPLDADVERALRNMIGAIHRGAVEGYLTFDRRGELLQFA